MLINEQVNEQAILTIIHKEISKYEMMPSKEKTDWIDGVIAGLYVAVGLIKKRHFNQDNEE